MNYSELKTAVADWLHRDDLTSKIDTFIDLFEARANRMLRVPDMEQRATRLATDEYIALPSDFLEVRNIQVNTSVPYMLEYASPQNIDAKGTGSGDPRYYTIVGNEFQLWPSASGKTVEISYYKKIPALSDSNTSNWLLNGYEDYYLNGVIAEAYFYTMDDRLDRQQMKLAEFEALINKRGKNKAYGSGPITVMAA